MHGDAACDSWYMCYLQPSSSTSPTNIISHRVHSTSIPVYTNLYWTLGSIFCAHSMTSSLGSNLELLRTCSYTRHWRELLQHQALFSAVKKNTECTRFTHVLICIIAHPFAPWPLFFGSEHRWLRRPGVSEQGGSPPPFCHDTASAFDILYPLSPFKTAVPTVLTGPLR